MTSNTALFEADAYRVWWFASRNNWACGYNQIAEELGISENRVKYIIAKKRWTGRMRDAQMEHGVTEKRYHLRSLNHYGVDREINDIDLTELMR